MCGGVVSKAESGTTMSRPPPKQAEPLPSAFLDLAPLEEVSLDAWKLLFEKTGLPNEFNASRLSHEAIHEYLTTAAPSIEHLVSFLPAIRATGN